MTERMTMKEKKGLKDEIIYQYYYIALYDYEKGVEVEELKNILQDYKDKELYLECEGIRLAVEHIEFLQLINTIINENRRN